MVLLYVVLSSARSDDALVPTPSPKYALDPALVALGSAIKRIRKERGIAQEQLALLASVERSYMSSIERGMQNVGVMTVVKLSEALGVSVAQLAQEAKL